MIKITERNNKLKTVRIQTINDEPSMTDIQYAPQTDVNLIVGAYMQAGTWPASSKQGQYTDYSDIHSLQQVLEANKQINNNIKNINKNENLHLKNAQDLYNYYIEKGNQLTLEEQRNSPTSFSSTPSPTNKKAPASGAKNAESAPSMGAKNPPSDKE